jgi:peptide deformylase
MIHPIVLYGHHALEVDAEPITSFDDELRSLVDDMFETMYDAQGVGLAAPQIGLSKRLAVIDVGWDEDRSERIVLANPEIVAREGEQAGPEGCLSVPVLREPLKRASRVTVRAQDASGAWFERTGGGLLARAFEHEIDHLNGKLFFMRLGPLARKLAVGKIEKLKREGRWKLPPPPRRAGRPHRGARRQISSPPGLASVAT